MADRCAHQYRLRPVTAAEGYLLCIKCYEILPIKQLLAAWAKQQQERTPMAEHNADCNCEQALRLQAENATLRAERDQALQGCLDWSNRACEASHGEYLADKARNAMHDELDAMKGCRSRLAQVDRLCEEQDEELEAFRALVHELLGWCDRHMPDDVLARARAAIGGGS